MRTRLGKRSGRSGWRSRGQKPGWSRGAIPVLIAVIGGVFIYGHGGIFEWNLIKACGTLWWFSSIGMTFVHPDYRTLVFIPLILLGYIMPGWVLRRKYRKVRTPK